VSVAGKHAVVTGATRGIGLAIAQWLQSEGARVSLVGRTPASVGAESFFASADVRDEAAIQSAFGACRAANGRIEILINNAGVVETATLERTTTAMWESILATNLTGTFLCTREVFAEMRAAGFGRIVNVASTAGLAGAPYISAYCASKHGVVGFTRATAAEVDGTGVTVNAICPGYTETEILRDAVANIMARTGRNEEATRAQLAQSNPQGRIASVDEVVWGVAQLIEGSSTGTALIVPGFTEA
jgi:3-hydroxybutyrate dehydrogenase